MRVCLILEGSYPYVHGGVSTWTHHFIEQSPDVDYVLWCISARAEDRGRFVYELPANVVEVHEVGLDDDVRETADAHGKPRQAPVASLDDEERIALARLIACDDPDWGVLRSLVLKHSEYPAALLASSAFVDVLGQLCREKYPNLPFVQLFYTVRSMLLPVLYLLAQNVPCADLYHPICTGYAGLLAAIAKQTTGRPVILTEHGIYSREREEEIIRADWVLPYFKRAWIRFFYMLSDACYRSADVITSLFSGARRAQIELGADADRCFVISNGIDVDRFGVVPPKEPDGWTDIGAPIRFAPIKDVKTLIRAFYELSCRRGHVRLHVCGGVDDEDYARECRELAEQLGLTDIVLFPGRVDMVSYMARFDFTILSSISEGQPLSVLESFSAARPVVATDVGSCRDLVEGEEGDVFGPAGIIVAPMDYEGMADAMQRLVDDPVLRARMGRAGRDRANGRYRQERMMDDYMRFYRMLVPGGEA